MGTKKAKIQIVRGNKNSLPNLLQGELGYATDSNELFIGDPDDGNVLINTNTNPYDDTLLKNNITDIEEALVEVNSQLENNTQQNTISNDMQFGSYDGCIVSFVTDDGQETDYSIFYKQIFEPEGVPANNCLITDKMGSNDSFWLNIEKIQEMKKAGWTIASHSSTHINIEGKTYEEIYNDLKKSKDYLVKNNLDYDFYISPFGGYNEIVDSVARKLFRCHFTTDYKFTDGATDINGNNKLGFMDNYNIYRRNGIGEKSPIVTTKQDMINDINYAKNNNLWLVFVMHSHYEAFTSGTGIQDLREVIQYCKSNNIPIMNLKDAFRLKGNKVDLGNRNVDKKWKRIDCNGVEFNEHSVSINTSTSEGNKFLKIATLEVRKKNLDVGVRFNYHLTNISNDDGNTNTGEVIAVFRNNNGTKLDSLFINNVETTAKSVAPISFVAKQVEINDNKSNVEIYAKLNKNYSSLVITNKQEILENYKLSYVAFENLDTYVADLTYDFSANVFGKIYLHNQKPTFASIFKGQTVIDTTNKDVYMSYDIGYNKWISLTGEQGVFTPTIKGKTTNGTNTYTTQSGRYNRFGKMVNFDIVLQGTFGSDMIGDIVIDGLPFSANGRVSLNVGYQQGFGSNHLTNAYISSGKEIVLNKTGSSGSTSIKNTDCNGNFNIWISGSYTAY